VVRCRDHGSAERRIDDHPGREQLRHAPPSPDADNSSCCLGDLVRSCLGSTESSDDRDRGARAAAYRNEAVDIGRPTRRSDASPRPSFLYVASNRPPSQVFDEGFPREARGLGLLRSVLDDPHSALTTPTAAPLVAFNDALALGHINDLRFPHRVYLDEPVPVWVYEIRADTSFYDVDESILWNLSQPGSSPGFRSRLDRQSLYSAVFTQRWATVDVPAENVRRSFLISHDTVRPSCPVSSPVHGRHQAHGGPASDEPPPF
jgi:hypothetical protein